MIEKFSFFDAEMQSDGTYDRTYASKDIADYFSSFVGNGIYANSASNLKVVPADGGVQVLPGKAWINGYFYELAEEPKLISLETGDALYSRIDSIVCSLNFTKRIIEIKVVKGSASSAPVAQEPQRNNLVYDLVLAHVEVKPGVLNIVEKNITDTRFDSNLCGIVSGVIEQIDTSNLFSQYDAEFEAWFEGIKGTLSGDVAANLSAQITEVKSGLETVTNTVNAIPSIRSGVELPDNNIGIDGDIYIQVIQ